MARHSINRITWPFTCESIRRKNRINAICAAYHLLRQAIWEGTWRATITLNRTSVRFAIVHSFFPVIFRITYDLSTHTNDHSTVMCAEIHFRDGNYCVNTNNCTVKSVSNVNTVIKYFHNRPVDEDTRYVYITLRTNQAPIWIDSNTKTPCRRINRRYPKRSNNVSEKYWIREKVEGTTNNKKFL